MPPLYVIQQNARLRISNRRLQVTSEEDGADQVLASLPLSHVTQVVLLGNISLTTPAIHALLFQGVEVVFLTEDGDYRGRLVGQVTPHVPLRRQQYRRLDDPHFDLEMSKGLVAAKIASQRTLLMRHNHEHPDPRISEAIEQLHYAMQAVPRKETLSGLLGLEGSSTAAYFGAYRRFFAPEWRFEDRNRRPPHDPVNVLLSFGYTLLSQVCLGAVQAVGLDPYAGFLHEIAYNRPSAALDLMEEFRPMVDGIIMWCCRSGQLTPADFTPGPAERPIILCEQGQKRFLKAFEERLEAKFTHPRRAMQFSMRLCIQEQARQIADRIMNGPPGYQGMGFR